MSQHVSTPQNRAAALQNSNSDGAGYEQLIKSGENMRKGAKSNVKKVSVVVGHAYSQLYLTAVRKSTVLLHDSALMRHCIEFQNAESRLQGTKKIFGKKR